MKLLLILLACIAVTSAATYYQPRRYCSYSYSYYCRQRFRVYPKTTSYSFRIYYKKTWCSYKYYDQVLCVYPPEKSGKAGWIERPVDEVMTEKENILKESLLKITQQMELRKTEWMKCLTDRILAYQTQYETYMFRYYRYSILCAKPEDKAVLEAQRDSLIRQYKEKLEVCKTEAITKYCDAMAEKIASIREYHIKLLDNARKCLETRRTKIMEYSVIVEEKIAKYVKQFSDCHMAVLDQKEKCYRALLDCIHGKDFEPEKTNAVIELFRNREMEIITKLVTEYAAKLAQYRETLITYYACAYRCYLSNGCLQFYKKAYYSSCRRLGYWYKYKSTYVVKKYYLSKFQYTFRKTGYTYLKTCKTMPVKTIAEITEPLLVRMEAVITSAIERFNSWHAKWERYHTEYKRCYAEVIRKRHAWCIQQWTAYYVCRNNCLALTDEQKAHIASIQATLEAHLVKCCDAYTAKLAASLLECKEHFERSIDEYRLKVTTLINKVGVDYQNCIETRATKIAEYEKKVNADIELKKEKFAKEIACSKKFWLMRYEGMYKFFHGDVLPQACRDLHDCHVEVLNGECDARLEKCVADYIALIPRLIEHYACCYTCGVGRFCLPTFCYGKYFRWTVKYPSAYSYRYKYKTYTRCYNYRIRYVKYRYVYC